MKTSKGLCSHWHNCSVKRQILEMPNKNNEINIYLIALISSMAKYRIIRCQYVNISKGKSATPDFLLGECYLFLQKLKHFRIVVFFRIIMKLNHSVLFADWCMYFSILYLQKRQTMVVENETDDWTNPKLHIKHVYWCKLLKPIHRLIPNDFIIKLYLGTY